MPLYSSWQADANREKRHLRPGRGKAAGTDTARGMEPASSSGLVPHGPAALCWGHGDLARCFKCDLKHP